MTPTIGTRLRQLRTELGLSTRDLHQRSGVSVPLLEAVEADELGAGERLRGFDTIRLCKVLGCSVDWLRHGAGQPPRPPCPRCCGNGFVLVGAGSGFAPDAVDEETCGFCGGRGSLDEERDADIASLSALNSPRGGDGW